MDSTTLKKAREVFEAGQISAALEVWKNGAVAGDYSCQLTLAQIIYLSQHRFKEVQISNKWNELTEEDFQIWDAEDGEESFGWCKLAGEPMIQMHEIVYLSPMTGVDRGLVKAVLAGNFEAVPWLLSIGANPEITTQNGFSSLIWLCQRAHPSSRDDKTFGLIKLLIDEGVNVNKPSDRVWSPLAYVAQLGHLETVKFLVANGATINDCGPLGSQALYNAAMVDNFVIAWFLLTQGAEVNSTPYDDYTPLMAACSRGAFSAAYLLISFGADVNRMRPDGKTALSIATENQHEDIVTLLKSYS